MALIIQKFGGTSVASTERVLAVAKIITDTAAQGNHVVAVVSAQGKMTDQLIGDAMRVNRCPPPREMDALLSAGEQMSAGLCAMAIAAMGWPAISLTGWQAGLRTDCRHNDATIRSLQGDRIWRELAQGKIVLVAGFQGIDKCGDITTLGRGGSDTTAVALAAFLHADRCQIYTDVDGVYDRDPRHFSDAVKLDTVSYDTMLSMISEGAQVLHDKSVLLARQYGIPIEVRSSFCPRPGTIVGP